MQVDVAAKVNIKNIMKNSLNYNLRFNDKLASITIPSEMSIQIRRATGPRRVRVLATVPSPWSLFPSGTGLQFWSPGGYHLWYPGRGGLERNKLQHNIWPDI